MFGDIRNSFNDVIRRTLKNCFPGLKPTLLFPSTTKDRPKRMRMDTESLNQERKQWQDHVLEKTSLTCNTKEWWEKVLLTMKVV